MERSRYTVKKIKNASEIDSLPKAFIDKYVWGGEYRPEAYAQLGFIDGEGLYFKLTCFESAPKAVYKNYNDQVWLDSCLEFFVSPCNDDKRYLNIEMNSAGAYLCGLRYSRENKVDIATVAEPPKVKATKYADRWTVEGLLSLETVEKVFGRFDKEFKGNLYKCGDETEIPHFGMWSPVGTETPDFHRPEYFGDFVIED